MRGVNLVMLLSAPLVACSPTQSRGAGATVTIVPSGATTGAPSANDAARESALESIAVAFAEAWDSGLGAAEVYVDPLHGIWMLYDPTIADCPIHYSSLAEAITQAPPAIQAPLGMGANLKAASFRCKPQMGPAPDLGNCRDEQPASTCAFGKAQPVLRESFLADCQSTESRETSVDVTYSQRAAYAIAQERDGTYFLTDSVTGIVFYFTYISEKPRLLAVDNSDCLLHRHEDQDSTRPSNHGSERLNPPN
jgi:hypothetical protein